MSTRFFRAVASDDKTGHRFGLRLDDMLTNGPSTPIRAGVLLALDLGAVRDELAGVVIPFLEVPPCGDLVRLKREADGRWTVVDQDYASSVEEMWAVFEEETEDSLVDLAGDLADEGLPPGSAVAFEPSSEGEFQSPLGWEIGEEIRWVQADRGHDPEQYCGSVTSDYYFGTLHAFYDPVAEVCTLAFECT